MAKSVAAIVIVGVYVVCDVSFIIVVGLPPVIVVGVPPVIVVHLTSVGWASIVVQLTIVVGSLVCGCSDLRPEGMSSGTVVGRDVTPFVCNDIVGVCGGVAFRLSSICNEG